MRNWIKGLINIFLLVLIFLEAQANPTGQNLASDTVPLKIETAGPNLPPVGCSLFDKITFKNNKYAVRYPLDRFATQIGDFSAAVTGASEDRSRMLVYAYFPFGRSLQRPTSLLEYAPLKSPRTVFALQSDYALLSNRLFFAYVQAKDQLEVISYNEEAGRFEFQVVKDYSKDPKVYYAQRSQCIACHQGHAPILSVNSWNDSASVMINELRSALIAANGIPLRRDSDPGASDALKFLLIGRSPLFAEAIGNLDVEVRKAQSLADFQRIYVHGCASRECRYGLLTTEIQPIRCAYSGVGCSTPSQVVKRSPLRSENWATSELSTADYIEEFFKSSRLTRAKFETDRPVTLSEADQQELIDKLRILSTVDNPASSRRLNYDEFVHRASFIRWPYFRDEEMQQLKLAYERGSTLFEKRPLSFAELLREAGSEYAPQGSRKFINEKLQILPFAQLMPRERLNVFTDENLNRMQFHCGACHQTGESFPPQFLVGGEADVKSKVASLKARIKERLVKPEMPPTPELRAELKASGDDVRIIEYLDTLK